MFYWSKYCIYPLISRIYHLSSWVRQFSFFGDLFRLTEINFILPAVLPARFINGSRIVYLWCPPVLKALFERRANELTKNGSSARVVLQSTGRVDSKVRSVMSSNCSSHHNFVFIWFWTDTEKLSFRSGRWLSRWQFSWKVYVARCTLEEAFLKYFIRTDSEVLRCKFFFIWAAIGNPGVQA